jgi:transposase-like protein/IS1 family transposase
MMSTANIEKTLSCQACKVDCQRFGKHRNGLRRFRCPKCHKTFTEAHQRTLGDMYIPQDRAVLALQLLLEGSSIRATERITKLDRNTIMSLLLKAGARCEQLLDAKMQNLTCKHVQLDELWCFVQKKARNIRQDDPEEWGDQWIFVALDADSKLVPTFFVGKRTMGNTTTFAWDLYSRLANPVQITTDGLNFYTKAIPECFGLDVDFAQLVKLFGDFGQHDSEGKYSPSRIMEVITKVRSGKPDSAHISTSYVERQNLTLRMQLRRLTRLTNGFSKKLSHLKAAVALHFAYYNFCRIHSSIRVTPAMEAGITDHIWTIAELLQAA